MTRLRGRDAISNSSAHPQNCRYQALIFCAASCSSFSAEIAAAYSRRAIFSSLSAFAISAPASFCEAALPIQTFEHFVFVAFKSVFTIFTFFSRMRFLLAFPLYTPAVFSAPGACLGRTLNMVEQLTAISSTIASTLSARYIACPSHFLRCCAAENNCIFGFNASHYCSVVQFVTVLMH